jgi:hypothetical protein
MKHRYATAGLAAAAAVASLGLSTAAGAATTAVTAAPRSIVAATSHVAARSHGPARRHVAVTPHVATRSIVAVRHHHPVAKGLGYIMVDCNGGFETKPSSYTLACADAGMGLEAMHWTSWSAKGASGDGTFYQNGCAPDCAQGQVTGYPVVATLWGSGAVPRFPRCRRYTEVTLVFTGQRPPDASEGTATYPLTQAGDTIPGPA